MVAYEKPRWVSPETYLEQERRSEIRHEYHDGIIIAMPGGTRQHSRITVDLTTLLNVHFKKSKYEVFNTDMRLNIPACRRYYYPDVAVVGDEDDLLAGEPDNITAPILVVEVLSDSTEALDRGEKFQCYQTIAALQTYILVSQKRPQIEVFTRQGEQWVYSSVNGLEAELNLPVLGITLPLADIYARVVFPPPLVLDTIFPDVETETASDRNAITDEKE